MKRFIKALFITCMFFLCLGVVNAEVITSIVATSNVNTIPSYGAIMERPTFNITNGSQVEFSNIEGGWYHYENSKWTYRELGYPFSSGRWQYRAIIRSNNESYTLNNYTTVNINGDNWTYSYSSTRGSATIYSPEYIVEADGNMHFFAHEKYRIFPSYNGVGIYSYSVTSTVEGGTSPFRFEKVSGPDWISVSEDGMVSGTPTVVGNNSNLVVRVTDANDNQDEITIPVGKTILHPSLREIVTNINATSNIDNIPSLGAEIIDPTFNISGGEGEFFADYAGDWYKKIGSKWEKQTGNFTTGVWQYRTHVVLEGEPAESYRLTDDTVVMVNGIDWHAGLGGVSNEYSYLSVSSKEYYVTEKLNSITLNGNITAPKIGDDITNPIIWVEAFNNDTSLGNIATVEAYWQYKTGEGFFDWHDASGKFENNKTYHIRFLVTITSDVYSLENIPNFPATFEGYTLTRFQFNNKTIGFFIEFPELKELTTPEVNITSEENRVTLTWNNQDMAVKYEIYRSLYPTRGFKRIATITSNEFTNINLTYGKVYYYKVRAYDGTKWSDYSIIKASNKLVPKQVQNVSFVSAGTNSIKLSWDKAAYTGYEIYMGTSETNMKRVKSITRNSILSFNKTGLKANTSYYFKVRAYKTVSGRRIYGDFSETVLFKTAPSKPTIKVNYLAYKEFIVSANNVPGAAYYVVEYSTKKSSGFTQLGVSTDLSIGLPSKYLEVGKTYYYRVKTCNEEYSCSAYSKVVSKKVIPDAPSIINLESLLTKQVSMEIDPVEDGVGYEIYRSTNKRTWSRVKTLTNLNDLTYINNTKKGVNYYYKVRTYSIVNGKKVYSKLFIYS